MNGVFGALDTWNAIAVADDASQVSTSWGVCETALQQGAPGTLQVENEIFEQTAAQGQTVFASAGDDGSDDCAGHGPTAVATNLSLIDPASQPYVTSVGGTTITSATAAAAGDRVEQRQQRRRRAAAVSPRPGPCRRGRTRVAVPQTTADRACSNDPSGTADNFHLPGLATTLPAGTAVQGNA